MVYILADEADVLHSQDALELRWRRPMDHPPLSESCPLAES